MGLCLKKCSLSGDRFWEDGAKMGKTFQSVSFARLGNPFAAPPFPICDCLIALSEIIHKVNPTKFPLTMLHDWLFCLTHRRRPQTGAPVTFVKCRSFIFHFYLSSIIFGTEMGTVTPRWENVSTNGNSHKPVISCPGLVWDHSSERDHRLRLGKSFQCLSLSSSGRRP